MLHVFHWKMWALVATFALLFFVILYSGGKNMQYAAKAVIKAFLFQPFEEVNLLEVIKQESVCYLGN